MERELLRKVQLTQLEIAKEIKRVCDENGIKYSLDSGTMLGAVRHKGFIPWDDDLDMGMSREDYEHFCAIAPEKLDEKYYFQTWKNDKNYPLPFGKVRKRNTVYIEGKSNQSKENGIFVDIFPYDNAPQDEEGAAKLRKELCHLARIQLMKAGFKPWHEESGINLKKRIGYIFYQIIALFMTHDQIAEKYENKVFAIKDSETVYEQTGKMKLFYFPKDWCKNTKMLEFENDKFMCLGNPEGYLEKLYGDYMKLPPETERENRHQILEIDFGEE